MTQNFYAIESKSRNISSRCPRHTQWWTFASNLRANPNDAQLMLILLLYNNISHTRLYFVQLRTNQLQMLTIPMTMATTMMVRIGKRILSFLIYLEPNSLLRYWSQPDTCIDECLLKSGAISNGLNISEPQTLIRYIDSLLHHVERRHLTKLLDWNSFALVLSCF